MKDKLIDELIDDLLETAKKILEVKPVEGCTNDEAFVVGFVTGAFFMMEDREKENDKN